MGIRESIPHKDEFEFCKSKSKLLKGTWELILIVLPLTSNISIGNRPEIKLAISFILSMICLAAVLHFPENKFLFCLINCFNKGICKLG